MSKMKLIIKGIVTPEDALLAREHGADGVIVSNHGGRAESSGRGAIEALKDVVDAVGPNYPVLIDGGVRRGTDVFKALALGARAVGIGRPYLWGLAAFGQAGVDRVLEILNAELRLAMRQFGTPEISKITRKAVTWR
jgi:isopentenyl diphosphate isomerase/L-lactate dehydrogenase-like FMN-dependent dehydrogenase